MTSILTLALAHVIILLLEAPQKSKTEYVLSQDDGKYIGSLVDSILLPFL